MLNYVWKDLTQFKYNDLINSGESQKLLALKCRRKLTNGGLKL